MLRNNTYASTLLQIYFTLNIYRGIRDYYVEFALYGHLVLALSFSLYMTIGLDKIAQPDLLRQTFLMIKDQITSQERLFHLSTQGFAQVWGDFVFELE
jgi:Na+-translocating ferredoxin:NAD+ oxidoreductase RnfD subunit